MAVYGAGFRGNRGRDSGLYAPQPPAIPTAPRQYKMKRQELIKEP
jgi:hypothetical protein